MNSQDMISLARSEGFSAAAIADMRAIVFDSGFRKYCEENLCGRYGANYSCPPDCGTPDAMKARLSAYKSALVLQTKWDITDYRDMPAIKAAKQSHNQGDAPRDRAPEAGGYSRQNGGAQAAARSASAARFWIPSPAAIRNGSFPVCPPTAFM